MATRHNLIRNPALSVSDDQWFGPAGWARSTSLHASMPRSTGYAGAVAGEPAMSRATTAPGKYYTVTVSVRAIAPQTGAINIDWRTSALAYLSTTNGAGSDHGVISMAAASTGRFGVVGQAPTDGARITPVVAGLDAGGAQVTALMVREFDTLPDAEAALLVDLLPANYFDGDTPGATWDSTTGLSASTLIADEPATANTTFGAMRSNGIGRYRSRGSARTTFGRMAIATGLLPSASYDRARSRIRVTALGLPAAVIRAEVSSRPLGTTRWSPVRGGRVAVVAGRFSRYVDDYEFIAGEGMQYRIEAITSAENITPATIAQTAIVTVHDTLDQVWCKFIVAPSLNRRVRLVDWSEATRRARNAVFNVKGNPDPIVITDVHTSTSLAVELRTETLAEARALEDALGAGFPVFLHVPTSVPLDSMYAAVGDITWRPAGRKRTAPRVYTVPLTQVSPPPLSVVGPTLTWAALADSHASWSELVDAFGTWREVLG